MDVHQHDDGSATITTGQGSMQLTPENWQALLAAARRPGELDGPWSKDDALAGRASSGEEGDEQA